MCIVGFVATKEQLYQFLGVFVVAAPVFAST